MPKVFLLVYDNSKPDLKSASFKFALVTYPKKTQSVLKGGNAALKGGHALGKVNSNPSFLGSRLT